MVWSGSEPKTPPLEIACILPYLVVACVRRCPQRTISTPPGTSFLSPRYTKDYKRFQYVGPWSNKTITFPYMGPPPGTPFCRLDIRKNTSDFSTWVHGRTNKLLQLQQLGASARVRLRPPSCRLDIGKATSRLSMSVHGAFLRAMRVGYSGGCCPGASLTAGLGLAVSPPSLTSSITSSYSGITMPLLTMIL